MMTLKALNDLVGFDFIHEMSPLSVRAFYDNDSGAVSFVEDEEIYIRFETSGEYIAQVGELDDFNLIDEKDAMKRFWKVIDAGILPKK